MNALKPIQSWLTLFRPGFRAHFAPVRGGARAGGGSRFASDQFERSGEYRSNIRWSLYDSGFLGDDFTIGARGESWVIDAIRVWTVPGVKPVIQSIWVTSIETSGCTSARTTVSRRLSVGCSSPAATNRATPIF